MHDPETSKRVHPKPHDHTAETQLPTDPAPIEKPGEPVKKTIQPDFVYDPIKDKRHDLKKLAPRDKKRKPWWKKLLIGLLVAGVVAGIAFAIFTLRNVVKVAPNFFKLDQKLKGEDEGRVNVLLLGVGDPGHDGEGLADTNIVMSVDTRDKKVALISIPRDTRVKIPGYGYHKINNAHAYGDIPLAQRTAEDFLDIPIHYYVRANFTGLKEAVDAVGGIEVDNKQLLSDPEYPCDKNQWRSCGFKMLPGKQQVDGATALKYARCRKGTCGDDFGRASRQQEVITAIRAKALSLNTILNPAKITGLIQTAGNNVKTDMSVGEMMRLNDLTKDTPNDQFINAVFSLEPNGFLKASPDGSSDLVPVDATLSSIQSFVKNIFTVGSIWEENAKIVIENGTSVPGLGGKLENKITSSKTPVTIVTVTNAIKRDYSTTQIIDYTGGKKNATKTYLEGLLKVSATAPEKEVKNPSQDFVIIIGSDYGNYLPTASSSSSSSQR